MDNKKIGMIILELDYNGDLTIHLSESSRHRYPDMTHYTQYINYHVGLLQEFKASVMTQMPFFTEESANEEHTEFVQTLEALAEMTQYSEAMNEKGQWLISRVVSTYSQLMPALPRDLLWFLVVTAYTICLTKRLSFINSSTNYALRQKRPTRLLIMLGQKTVYLRLTKWAYKYIANSPATSFINKSSLPPINK